MDIADSDKGILNRVVVSDLDVSESIDDSLLQQLSSKAQYVAHIFDNLLVPNLGHLVRQINSLRKGVIFREQRQSDYLSTACAILALTSLGVLPEAPAKVLDGIRSLLDSEQDERNRRLLIAAEQEFLSLWGRLY